jgi:hypothetical protein
MTDSSPKVSERLSILHPKIMTASIIVLIVGSFNTLGQKFLIDPDYGNFKHSVYANLGMFFGEYLNYIIFMILCLIPKSFKSINKTIYQRVNLSFKNQFPQIILIHRK